VKTMLLMFNTSLVRLVKRLAALFFVCALVSCASKVRTNITTFTNENTSFSVGTIQITNLVPRNNQNSLQFEFYKRKLAAKLEGIGYKVVDSDNADFIAFLDYGVVRRERESDNTHLSVGLGYGRYSRFGRVVFTEPFTREFEYLRRVHLAIEDNVGQGERPSESTKDKLVELDAVSLGRCAQLLEVFDPMLEAIFKNLYRANGSTEKVVVPGGGACK